MADLVFGLCRHSTSITWKDGAQMNPPQEPCSWNYRIGWKHNRASVMVNVESDGTSLADWLIENFSLCVEDTGDDEVNNEELNVQDICFGDDICEWDFGMVKSSECAVIGREPTELEDNGFIFRFNEMNVSIC